MSTTDDRALSLAELAAIGARYARALDAKPSKGDYTPRGIDALTDSVCDVPTLLDEVKRLTEVVVRHWREHALAADAEVARLTGEVGALHHERDVAVAAVQRERVAAEREVERLTAERDGALASAVAFKTERDRLDEQYPCDGGCNYDGPAEHCSRHGRTPAELWTIIADLAVERNRLRGFADAVLRNIEPQWRSISYDRNALLDELRALAAEHGVDQ
jgi:hypothetical protein